MKGKSICLVVLLSVASLYSALGATTVKKSVTFTSDMSLPSFYEVECEVDETGVRIIAPKTVAKPAPYTLLQDQLSFLGYYGRFHTTDSGEKEVELKVFDENGNAVEFLPGVVLPPAPDEFYAKWAPKEDPKPPKPSDPTKYGDGTEPIMFFLQHFMAGDSRFKFDEYNDRIRNDDEDYEAYICRGFTWLTSLSEDKDVMNLVKKFGFMVNDEHGTINFSPISSFDFGSGLQYNRDIDAACEKAVPVLKAALADFEKVPKNWSGSVDFQEGFEVTVCFDYADSLVARSVVSEMLSFLYLMKGYNTVAADGTTKPIDLEALAEARRWMKTAAEFVNAFVIAQDARTDYFKDYFFNLNETEAKVLRENARNLVDVSDWTVQFDLVSLSPFFFLTGDWQSDETKKSRRKAKREKINGVGTLDVTLRNVFEGKLSADDGTFPSLSRGAPLLDASVPDPTFAGTFPGISRMVLAELLSTMPDENVQSIPGEEIAHYGVFYKLPEGAENNPGNPATFSADLESPIALRNPSMAGYLFTGWAPYGVIQVGAEETLTFRAMFIEHSEVDPREPESFHESGIGTDGKFHSSVVENISEGDVENPVKVTAIEGLLDLAKSINKTITLKVVAKDASNVDPAVAGAISNELEKVSGGGFDSVAFVDLSILFDIDEEAQEDCELGAVIKLHIPRQVKPGGTYGVVRMHKGEAQVIPQGEANKTEDGEYFEVDVEKGELVLCVSKFSIYAIAEASPVKVGDNATAAVEQGNCTISGEGLVTGFPSGFDCGSISNAVLEFGITEIGAGFFYPCLSLKRLEIGNPAAANGLEKAVVYRTAINPDGTLSPIPSISIPGYQEVLCGRKELTDKDGWQQVQPGTKMEESGYHFFKYVLKRD